MRPVVEVEAERRMLDEIFKKRNGYSKTDCIFAPKQALFNVVQMYLKEEKKHHEANSAKNHIYHDLRKLRRALIEGGCDKDLASERQC